MAGIGKVTEMEWQRVRQFSPGLGFLSVVGYSLVGLLWIIAGAVAVSHHRSAWFYWVLGLSFLLLGAFWAVRLRRSRSADRTTRSSSAPEAFERH